MRVMRLLVLFDLPTGSKAERRQYSEFRKFLIQDGYHMEQFSVYSRLLVNASRQQRTSLALSKIFHAPEKSPLSK